MGLEVIILRPHTLILITSFKPLHSPFFLLKSPHHLTLHLIRLLDDLLHLVSFAFRFSDDGDIILAVEFDEIGEMWPQVDEKSSSQVLDIIPCEFQLLDKLLVADTQELAYLGYAVAADIELLQLLELFDSLQ